MRWGIVALVALAVLHLIRVGAGIVASPLSNPVRAGLVAAELVALVAAVLTAAAFIAALTG